MTRVGTFAQQQLLMFHTLRTQERLFAGSIQLASGQKAQQYSGIANNVSRLLAVESAQLRSQEYLQNIDVAQRRIELTDFNLDGIEGIARALRGFLEDAGDSPHTSILREGNGNDVLHMKSEGTSFGLYKKIQVNLKEFPILTWRWKVEQLPDGGI